MSSTQKVKSATHNMKYVGVPYRQHISRVHLAKNHRHPYGNTVWTSLADPPRLYSLQNTFIFTFRYIDDILSINNQHFANWIPLIYPQRTWDKRNDFHYLISWHSNRLLRQKRLQIFLIIYFPKYTNRFRVWCIYFTTHLPHSRWQLVFILFTSQYSE